MDDGRDEEGGAAQAREDQRQDRLSGQVGAITRPLDIEAGDAYGNRKRELAFNRARDIARLGKPADRSEWGMAPQTVNAYYNPTWNEIVFPAAILQPPFFDPNADAAVNYGGIGGVIGHEMGHGFDDQGAKSDENGMLHKWWSAQDEERFKALTDKLADQYSKFEPLPGLHRQRPTHARREHRRSRRPQHCARGLQDLARRQAGAGDRRLHRRSSASSSASARSGARLIRDEALRNQIVADPHSPAEFRANGTVRNTDEWYEAFAVKEGATLYLPPDRRVRIW